MKSKFNVVAPNKNFSIKKPLTDSEKEGVIVACKSAFMKLKNLYDAIIPIFDNYGFKPPSAGVIARDLSEKIETSIIQHCKTFSKGLQYADLLRDQENWEVKICKNHGLSINQSFTVKGENYIVVNYHKETEIKKIFILWHADDSFFSERKSNANIRNLKMEKALSNIEIIYSNTKK